MAASPVALQFFSSLNLFLPIYFHFFTLLAMRLCVPPPSYPTSTQSLPHITTDQVWGQLRKVWPSKAAGLENGCLRLLKTCAAEVGEPLQQIFNLSLQLGRVPNLLHHSGPEEEQAQRAEWIPTSGTHFTPDEDVGAALSQPPQIPGTTRPGPPAVCAPARCWYWGCHPPHATPSPLQSG